MIRDVSGLSLVEVMAASLVVAVLATALGSLGDGVLRAHRAAEAEGVATDAKSVAVGPGPRKCREPGVMKTGGAAGVGAVEVPWATHPISRSVCTGNSTAATSPERRRPARV